MHLQRIKADQIAEIAQKDYARRLKRSYIKQGYEYQISFYGVLTDREANKSEYRRIEVLSNTPMTEALVMQLYEFFRGVKPFICYTIWIYDKKYNGVKLVGKYE